MYKPPCMRERGLMNAHLCLCSQCFDPDRVAAVRQRFMEPDHPDLREPNGRYPDCSECYSYWDPLLKDVHEMYCGEHIPAPKADSRKADPGTEYAFTLTMPPTYEPKKPIEEAARLICENGLTNKPYEKAEQWAIVLEHTDAGVPHVHGVYKTPSGRRIAAKYFQRYWPLWDEKTKLGNGHKGGYHQKARHTESYEAYLLKEGVVKKSLPEV